MIFYRGITTCLLLNTSQFAMEADAITVNVYSRIIVVTTGPWSAQYPVWSRVNDPSGRAGIIIEGD